MDFNQNKIIESKNEIIISDDIFRNGYWPVYLVTPGIIGFIFLVFPALRNGDDDLLFLAQLLFAPFVLVLLVTKNKFRNRLLFHILMSFFIMPILLLMVGPLIAIAIGILIQT